MSHTLASNPILNTFPLLPVKLTIIDYATGGEVVTPDELGVTTISGVIFGTVPAGQNSLGGPLFPLLNAGKVMLFRFTSGSPVEIAATVGLNASITALVFVSAY